MGTKEEPGEYDCYAKLAPDEPHFTLRAKDPAAPYLVRMWSESRRGDRSMVMGLASAMLSDPDVLALVSSDGYEKLREAFFCADAMRDWRVENAPVERRADMVVEEIVQMARRLNSMTSGARAMISCALDREGL